MASTFRLSDKSEITLAVDDMFLIEDKSNSYTTCWTSPLAIKTWLESYFYTETEIDTWRASVSVSEMGYLHGVTSDVQTQINTKASSASQTTLSGNLQTDIDTRMTNLSDDLNPELGGDLGCGGYNLDNIGKYCAVSSATTVCNQTGSTLTKGMAVTISGLSGETCCVIKSDNRELDKTPVCGVVYADITNGNTGCMITLGRITMDTSGMTGTEEIDLYVQSDGSLDTAIPTSGAVQRVGFLVKKAAGSAGRICVCIRGRKSIYSAKDEHPIIKMGSEAGHTKIEFKDYTDNEIMTVDSSGNLTLSGTVDGVDVATLKSDYDGHDHTESDITDLDHNAVKIRGRDVSSTDTPANGESITWYEAGSEWRYTMISGGAGGSSNHSELNELDYASAGHTGFASSASQTTLSGNLQTNIDGKSDTGHTHGDIYYTETEIDTWRASTTVTEMSYVHGITSDVQTQIDGKSATAHTHDGRYYTETEIDTWRASTTVTEMSYVHGITSDVQTQIDTKAATSLTAAPASDHTAEGPQTNDINAGEAVTVIDCVYLKSDGEWWKTDADAVATAEGMLAISLETKTDGQAMNVALPGSFIRDDTWTWTVGGEIYLSCTGGALTQTVVSGTDDVARIVGHATHADRMFFNPEQTIVVHS